MDESVRRAMAEWPNVPHLFGWLRLDRRGNWYVGGELIERPQVIEFIGRNYHCDERGRWFFQNGPQRGYVTLDYTPWIYRSQPDGTLRTHTGLAGETHAALVDEGGTLLLETEHGVGVLHDADLDWALQRLVDADGEALDDAALEAAIEALDRRGELGAGLRVGTDVHPVRSIRSEAVAGAFGFMADPQPDKHPATKADHDDEN